MVVFGKIDMLSDLCAADTMFVDGTFKMAPAIFRQIFTIHIRLQNTSEYASVIFALLPNKLEATYTQLLKEIKTLCEQHGFTLDPANIMADFEVAITNAVTTVFGPNKLRGCFFHLTQATHQ